LETESAGREAQMSGFEIGGTFPSGRMTVIPPAARTGDADDRNPFGRARWFAAPADAGDPLLPTADAFVVQLLAARWDFPQARQRRRAAPDEGAGAYQSGLGLAGPALSVTISRLV
jgi:hypothetical protein